MKPFNKITRLGRLRRFHQMAREALKEYGFTDARLTFFTYNGNVIYRVDRSGNRGLIESNNPYITNRYILRIHMDYHSLDAINSEMQWLSALRNDIDLPVPEPVPAKDGNLVIEDLYVKDYPIILRLTQ